MAENTEKDKAASSTDKEDVLDLLDGEEPKKNKKTTPKTAASDSSGVLPPISVIKQEEQDAAKRLSSGGNGAADNEDSYVDHEKKVVHIKPPIMLEDLASKIGEKPFKLIKELMEMGVFANAKASIEPDVAAKLCEEHGFTFEREKRAKGGGVHKVEEVIEEPVAPVVEESKQDDLSPRAPIITFMGHVDHGKTSLLDAVRKTKVVDGEAGGITQHIGAYSVERNGQTITFIDTPGHAAFAEMRARGANVTDIVVLVVAANDGLMAQTIEAISHAKAAGVTIIVAINKIDMPGADSNRVKTQLQEQELTPVDWGGEIECVEVSATEGTGIDDLLETMLVQSEVLELKANPKGAARATIIEAKLEPGKGPTGSVIIESGTLKVGDSFICGPYAGKVKSLLNEMGEQLSEAGPATPVEVLGFSSLPSVGDELIGMKSDREAKKLGEQRQEDIRQEKLKTPQRASFDSFMESLEGGESKTLNLVLKTDVAGTAEAIIQSLSDIESDKVDLKILHSGAGAISESDILLASASEGIIVGFNTKLESKAVSVARKEGVEVRLYSIIYELLDQVKDLMLGMLDAETREKIKGHAEVKQVFKLSKRGKVAGCEVTDGKINRKLRARVIRDGQPVYDGGFATLQRFTDAVDEVKGGLECGIKLGDYTEYQVGDVIECYELEQLERKL